LRTIDDVNASGLWPGRVVTKVSPVGEFWTAEPEHQDYLERNVATKVHPTHPARLIEMDEAAVNHGLLRVRHCRAVGGDKRQ
jgi:peptide methionine sulfoxide reductase MsrA